MPSRTFSWVETASLRRRVFSVKVTLTAGGALHYEAGLVSGLLEQGIEVEVVGGDELGAFAIMHGPGVRFRNLHGKHDPNAPNWLKLLRVLRVYSG